MGKRVKISDLGVTKGEYTYVEGCEIIQGVIVCLILIAFRLIIQEWERTYNTLGVEGGKQVCVGPKQL